MTTFNLLIKTLVGVTLGMLTLPASAGDAACVANQTDFIIAPEFEYAQGKFGNAVAMKGDLLVIGTPSDGAGCPEGVNCGSGNVYVYERVNGEWMFMTTLQSDTLSAGDALGSHVAIADGPTILVGAPFEDGLASNSNIGYVFAFGLVEGEWMQVMDDTPDDIHAGDNFGQVFAVSGEDMVVGTPRDDEPGGIIVSDAGSVYFGKITENTPMQRLTPSDGPERNVAQFGFAVDIDGDTAIVGSPYDIIPFPNTTNFGQAYIYERDPKSDAWEEAMALVPDDPQFNAQFGCSVALRGDTAIVGAHFKDEGVANNNCGVVYVFERNAGGANNWGQVQKIIPTDVVGVVGDHNFGSSVQLDGDTLAVFADGQQTRIYIYHRTGGVAGPVEPWSYALKLAALAPSGTGSINGSGNGPDPLALSGSSVAIGYNAHGIVLGGEGSVFTFEGVDMTDCNNNGVADICDVHLMTSFDDNGNGIPDECESAPCPSDIVSSDTFQPPPDGVIDGADLAFLLGEWGPNPGSPADVVTSATFQPPPDDLVDGADLAFLLGAWGACP